MAHSTFDSILENKIGFGRYQVISYITLGLTQFSDSAEIVGLSILLPVLQNEWHITADDQGLLGTVLFLGIFAGSILGGYVSDKIGRRRALLHASWVQFLVGVISTMVTNMKLFILVRGLFGVMIGFTIPLTPALVSEITPVQYRGRGVVAVNFLFSLGKVYAVVVAKFCLDSLTSGNWRAMLIWCSFPSLLVWLGAWLHLKESPRFLIATGKVDEGVETLNYMAKVNNPYNAPRITQTEAQELENWQRSMFSMVPTADVRSLFSSKYKKITSLVWTMWFSLNFTFFGMLFILPFILSKFEVENSSSGTSGLNGLLLTIAGEVPSIAIAMYIIEKKFFGRKNTIVYCNIIATCIFLLAYIAPISLLIPLLTFARLFMKLNGAMLYPLTTEFYPTTFRTAGLGFASGVGRLGSALMPYVLIGMFNTSTLLPIFGFAVLSAIHGVAAFLLPYDTTGKQLDVIDESELRTMDKYVAMEKV